MTFKNFLNTKPSRVAWSGAFVLTKFSIHAKVSAIGFADGRFNPKLLALLFIHICFRQILATFPEARS
jgi:hypothetical protein